MLKPSSRSLLSRLLFSIIIVGSLLIVNITSQPLEEKTVVTPSIVISDEVMPDLVTHSIYLDGWTMRTLAGLDIIASHGEFSQPLKFTPLTADDITQLLLIEPNIVAEALSRMVSGDSSLRCDTSGCTANGSQFDSALLTQLTLTGSLSDMYQGWNITSGLYRAEVLAERDQMLTISAAGWDSLLLNTKSGSYVPTIITDTSETNGYGRNLWYIAGAWGNFFIPDVRWNDIEAVTYDIDSDYELSNLDIIDPDDLESISQKLPSGLFARGLADPVPSEWLVGFNRSELTYLTSPTTGCGPVSLCVPDKLQVKISQTSVSQNLACNVDGRYSVAVSVSSDWDITVLAPTHLFGAWNGVLSETFHNSDNYLSVLGYTGTPQMVGGLVSLRQLQTYLIDRRGSIIALDGSRFQIGIESSEKTSTVLDFDNFSNMFLGWSLCADLNPELESSDIILD